MCANAGSLDGRSKRPCDPKGETKARSYGRTTRTGGSVKAQPRGSRTSQDVQEQPSPTGHAGFAAGVVLRHLGRVGGTMIRCLDSAAARKTRRVPPSAGRNPGGCRPSRCDPGRTNHGPGRAGRGACVVGAARLRVSFRSSFARDLEKIRDQAQARSHCVARTRASRADHSEPTWARHAKAGRSVQERSAASSNVPHSRAVTRCQSSE